MGKFNLSEYEPVEVRIKAFYADHETGRITTELVSDVDKIETVAVFKAYVFDAEILLATGYAMELHDDGYINKSSHVENCETSAIGRALANIGLSGNKRASREEMEKVQRVESTDTERIREGRNTIHQLIEDNQALLLPEFITAWQDNAESAKTLADVKSVYRQVKAEVDRLMKAEAKVATEDEFTEKAAEIFNGEVVKPKIPESLAKALKEKDAGEGFKDDSAEIDKAVKTKGKPKAEEQELFDER